MTNKQVKHTAIPVVFASVEEEDDVYEEENSKEEENVYEEENSKEEEDDGEYNVEGRPEVKFIVSGGGDECEFILEDVDFERRDAAALRRIIMSALESMAIEIIEIVDNTSDLPDESIAQRLGMVPIRCVDVDDIPVVDDTSEISIESGKGIPFEMDITNDTSKTIPVTEENISITNKKCKTVTEGSPIFKLRPGQHFELRGLIQKGTGKIHVKWQPTTNVKFKHDEEKGRYILSLETNNRMTCREIITKSLEILEEQS